MVRLCLGSEVSERTLCDVAIVCKEKTAGAGGILSGVSATGAR